MPKWRKVELEADLKSISRSATVMIPPGLPSESIYTNCYCEENVYLLSQYFLETPTINELWEVFVVFISNQSKTVALWCQKAAQADDRPVVWDYHVILVLKPRIRHTSERRTETSKLQNWVYDFDTYLPMPCTWEDYLTMTFPENLLPSYESMFRIIPGEMFCQYFASDRSHMLLKAAAGDDSFGVDSGEPLCYSSPPPCYPPICGPKAKQQGISNNLMSNYVSMTSLKQEVYGIVVNRVDINEIVSSVCSS